MKTLPPVVAAPALRKSGLLRAAALAAAGAGFLPAAVAQSAAQGDILAQARQRSELRVGMHYVAPAFVPGSADKFRTPENVEHALAQDLAQRLQASARMVSGDAGTAQAQFSAGKADLLLVTLPEKMSLPATLVTVPVGYVAAPMAIMRTDTTIKTWKQLKGRTVCMPASSRYRGLAAGYGAKEIPVRAATDALLEVRVGTCDATIHDAALLEELLKLPEWKKFSARLAPPAGTPLVLVLPAGDRKLHAWAQEVVQQWRANSYPQQHLRVMARNMAFEVYIDQEVPDCH